jgi:hypothetical protein
MAAYKIYLGNPHGLEYEWKELEKAVVELFTPAIAKSRQYESVEAHETKIAPTLGPAELLVYVVANQFRSVLRSKLDIAPHVDAGGFTAWFDNERKDSGVGSEVYVAHTSPPYLAKLIFHEALHNKLRKDDRLHRHQGGLAAAGVGEATPATKDNYSLMAGAIEKHVRQWLGGFASRK